jgi:hypothetical protein
VAKPKRKVKRKSAKTKQLHGNAPRGHIKLPDGRLNLEPDFREKVFGLHAQPEQIRILKAQSEQLKTMIGPLAQPEQYDHSNTEAEEQAKKEERWRSRIGSSGERASGNRYRDRCASGKANDTKTKANPKAGDANN